jgi:hypothetical protein
MRKTILFSTFICFVVVFTINAQQQTADGGLIIAGGSSSYSNGMTDFLIYKIDAAGAKQWRKNFGGTWSDNAVQIQPTADGGYIVAGITLSYGPSPGSYCDFLVYKLDAAGNKQWRKNYGGAATENGKVARQTADGGYLVAGHSNSYSGPPSGKGIPAYYDMIVYKLDASGAKQWRKTYGGSDNDSCYDLILTAGGGFVAFGFGDSYSYDGTDDDFLAYRLDSAGAKLWRKNYGGAEHDLGYFTYQTGDGGFVFVGEGDSYCQTGTDVDLLVYKVNSAGVKLWRKNFGGDDDEFIESK